MPENEQDAGGSLYTDNGKSPVVDRNEAEFIAPSSEDAAPKLEAIPEGGTETITPASEVA